MVEESENAEDWEPSVSVGYLEDPPSAEERKLLTRRNFPSKVGGKPAWLVPKGLPELTCRTCSRPLRFLLQSYASRGWENPSAFHRVLHLFMCTECQPNEVYAFRAQLPRANEFYSDEPPNQEQVLAEATNDPELEAIICWDCGLPSGAARKKDAVDADVEEVPCEYDAVANRCHECSRRIRNGDDIAMLEERELTSCEAEDPEDEDEDNGGDAIERGGDGEEAPAAEAQAALAAAEAQASLALSMPAQGPDDAVLMEKLQEFRDRVEQDPENALDRSEQRVFDEWSKERGEKDDHFSKFQAFSDANPQHVVRHIFGGQPLWFATPGRLNSNPPSCPHCGGPRVFEMQVQPQLISLLIEGARPELAKRLDFGVTCVFVCEKSCSPADDAPYLQEFVHVQPEPHEAWLPK